MPSAATKTELRREMRARLRAAITGEVRAERSRAICDAIARQPAYLQARTVAIFDPMPAEPDVSLLWESAPRRFVYPRIDGAELLLIEVLDRASLMATKADSKFREPAHVAMHVVEASSVDVVLVPGLAFTRDGRRLGRGGGYYDRLLARLPARTAKLGVCFAEQLVADLPTEPHDIPVDAVITGSAASF